LRAAFEWLQRANPFYLDIAWNPERLPMAVTMVSSRVSADRSSTQNAAAADVSLTSPSRPTAAVVAADTAAAMAPVASSEVVVTDEYRLAAAMDVPVLDPYAALSGTAAAASMAAAAAAAASLAAADGRGPPLRVCFSLPVSPPPALAQVSSCPATN
jgi:hypothetical protein